MAKKVVTACLIHYRRIRWVVLQILRILSQPFGCVLFTKMLERTTQWRVRNGSKPPKGVYMSKTNKMAAETDIAQTANVATTVRLRGAKRPKLPKMTVSQKTSATRSGIETELVLCWSISQRVLPRSIAILRAWLVNEL